MAIKKLNIVMSYPITWNMGKVFVSGRIKPALFGS